VNGLLVPPRDSAGLARALGALLDDKVLQNRMGAEGRVLAEEKFGIGLVIQSTLAVYAALQKSRSA
jgi:glycosyltransferase involved in cell wall biosynthesis